MLIVYKEPKFGPTCLYLFICIFFKFNINLIILIIMHKNINYSFDRKILIIKVARKCILINLPKEFVNNNNYKYL
jgi:hypothetical protein